MRDAEQPEVASLPSQPQHRHEILKRVPWSALVVLIVFALGAYREIQTFSAPFTSGGDVALSELSILKIFHGGVALGPYSRFGWHHPGPAMFYLFAPIYWITGDNSRSLFLSSWLLNGACAIGVVLIVRRMAGELVSAVSAAVVLVFIDVNGFYSWINPWNPYLLAMPLLLLITAAAGAGGRARSDAWWWPGCQAPSWLRLTSGPSPRSLFSSPSPARVSRTQGGGPFPSV